jgi:hypothetical protein
MILRKVCVWSHIQLEFLMRFLTLASAIFVKQGRKVLLKYDIYDSSSELKSIYNL